MPPKGAEYGGYSKHGLTTLKTAVKTLGSRAIDKRTALGKALAQWRAELIGDLGGQHTVTTQQRAVVDVIVKTKLLLDSVDTWILTQGSLVNEKRKAVLPVVLQRQQLADSLVRHLGQLGLERRRADVPDLKAYLEARAKGGAGNGQGSAPSLPPAPAEAPASTDPVTNRPDSDSQQGASGPAQAQDGDPEATHERDVQDIRDGERGEDQRRHRGPARPS